MPSITPTSCHFPDAFHFLFPNISYRRFLLVPATLVWTLSVPVYLLKRGCMLRPGCRAPRMCLSSHFFSAIPVTLHAQGLWLCAPELSKGKTFGNSLEQRGLTHALFSLSPQMSPTRLLSGSQFPASLDFGYGHGKFLPSRHIRGPIYQAWVCDKPLLHACHDARQRMLSRMWSRGTEHYSEG